jgi:oligosaccharide repeat unit polymerase
MTGLINGATLLSLVAVALVCRRSQRSWYAPSAAFSGYWVLMMGLGLAGPGFSNVPVMGPASILFFVIAYSLGASVPIAPGYPSAPSPGSVFNEKRLRQVVLVAITVGLAAIPLYAILDPAKVHFSFSISGLRNFARETTLARYVDLRPPPSPVRIALVACYASAALGGVLQALARQTGRSQSKWVGMISALPSIFYGIATTTKATFIWGILLWLSGQILYAVATGGERPVFRAKQFSRLLRGLSVGLLLVLATLASFVLRYGLSGWREASVVIENLGRYTFAFLRNYSIWLSDFGVSSQAEFSLGQSSFGGISSFLGLSAREFGVYQDLAVNGQSTSGNIYTVFRGLVQDFGIFGGAACCLLIGLLSRYFYEGVRRRWKMPLSGSCLIGVYLVVGWGFTLNPLYYTTLNLALGCVAGGLYLSRSERPVAAVKARKREGSL